MDFWISRFRIEDSWADLEVSQSSCDFCKMRWDVAKYLSRQDYPSVSFERFGTMIRMNDGTKPVFSICRDPGKLYMFRQREITNHSQELQTSLPIQIGFPRIPAVRSESHFKMLLQWVKIATKLTRNANLRRHRSCQLD